MSIFDNLFNPQNAGPTFPSPKVQWPRFLPSSSPAPAPAPAALPAEVVSSAEGEPPMDKIQLLLKLIIPAIATAMAFKQDSGPAVGGLAEGYLGGEKYGLAERQMRGEEAYRRDWVAQRREAATSTAEARKESNLAQLTERADKLREQARVRLETYKKARIEEARYLMESLTRAPGAWASIVKRYGSPESVMVNFRGQNMPVQQVAEIAGVAVGPGGELVTATPEPRVPRAPTAIDYAPGSDVGTVVEATPGTKIRARSRPAPKGESTKSTRAQKIAAERWKQGALTALEGRIAKEALSDEQITAEKDRIQNSYLTQLGLSTRSGSLPKTAPASPYRTGQTVRLKDGSSVTIKKINPDGTFEY